MTDDRAPIIRDARGGPPVVETTLTWIRTASGRFPEENDARTFLLQLHDGTFAVGRRRTLLRTMGPGGAAFIRASSVPHVPTLETHFVEAATGSVPVENVRAWAAI